MNGRAVRVPGLLTLTVVALIVTSIVPSRVVSASPAPSGPIELGYCGGDDWEPSLSAAGGGRLYALITHYGGDTTCDPTDGLNNARIMIQVSTDDGTTFGAPLWCRVRREGSLIRNRPIRRSPWTPPARTCT